MTVTITGTNDAATVSSARDKSVTEGNTAAALNTSGQLTITDPDRARPMLWRRPMRTAPTATSRSTPTGAWTYTGNGAHDELTAGQQVHDQFTVTSQDGTATGTVTVTITGTNDAPVITSGAAAVAVSEEGLPNGVPDTLPAIIDTRTARLRTERSPLRMRTAIR